MFNKLITLIESKNINLLIEFCKNTKLSTSFLVQSECALEFFHCSDQEQHKDLIGQYINLARVLGQLNNNEVQEIVGMYLGQHKVVSDLLMKTLAKYHSVEILLSFIKLAKEKNNPHFLTDMVAHLINLDQDDKLIALSNAIDIPAETLMFVVRKRKSMLLRELLKNPHLSQYINCVYYIYKNSNRSTFSEFDSYRIIEEKSQESLLSMSLKLNSLAMVEALKISGASDIAEGKEKSYTVRSSTSPIIALDADIPSNEPQSDADSPKPVIFSVDAIKVAAEDPEINYEIIKLLTIAPNVLQRLLLMMIEFRNFETVKKLLEENDNNYYNNLDLRLALLNCAVAHYDKDFIDYLLKDNPKLGPIEERCQANKQGDPLLANVLKCKLNDEQKYELAIRLINLGALRNASVFMNSQTVRIPLLHVYVKYGSCKLLSLFNPKETNYQAVCDQGRTALDYAFMAYRADIIKLILDQGIKPSKTIYINRYLTHRDDYIKQTTETALIILSLPYHINELTFVEIDADNKVERQYNVSTYIEYLPRKEDRTLNIFLLRAYLEAGAIPEVSYILHLVRNLEEKNISEILEYLHVISLCVDFGFKLTEEIQHELNNAKDYMKRTEPTACVYLESLIIQSQKAKIEEGIQLAFEHLKTNVDVRSYGVIWHRLGVLSKKMGKYEESFQYLQKAQNQAICMALRLPYERGVESTFSDNNDIVELLCSWDQSLEQNMVKAVDNKATDALVVPERIEQLFNIIDSFPCETLTPRSHFKMAEIYTVFEGLSLNIRYDLLKKHMPYARLFKRENERIQNFLSNLSNQENLFKYGLDTILSNPDLTAEVKIAKLRDVLDRASLKLKNIGVEFVLKHEATHNEKLHAAVKNIRKNSVVQLMHDVNALVISNKAADAVTMLDKAKGLPLYNMLKFAGAPKPTTKAIAKIDKKIEEIKSNFKLNN